MGAREAPNEGKGQAFTVRIDPNGETLRHEVGMKSHAQYVEFANLIDDSALVAHGKFAIDTQTNDINVITGLAKGSTMNAAPNRGRRVLLATIIVIPHRELGYTNQSPEDWLEDPTVHSNS